MIAGLDTTCRFLFTCPSIKKIFHCTVQIYRFQIVKRNEVQSKRKTKHEAPQVEEGQWDYLLFTGWQREAIFQIT